MIAASVGIVATDPAGRIRLFKARPGELETIERGDFVRAHLLSSGGSGRWQFWSAAVDGWRDAPVVGKGAGTYEAWWAQHGSIRLFVRDAHSLYLETLGGTRPPRIRIVLALVVTGLVVGVRRAQRADGDVRVTVAALTAAFAAFAAAAAFEWVWELTVVSVVAVAALALVAGQAAAAPAPLRAVDADARPRRSPGHRAGLVVASLLVAWILIIGQAVPLLAQRQIAESQEAVQDGDLDRALDAAAAARDIQPWAASPYLQLALVSRGMQEAPAHRLRSTTRSTATNATGGSGSCQRASRRSSGTDPQPNEASAERPSSILARHYSKACSRAPKNEP